MFTEEHSCYTLTLKERETYRQVTTHRSSSHREPLVAQSEEMGRVMWLSETDQRRLVFQDTHLLALGWRSTE